MKKFILAIILATAAIGGTATYFIHPSKSNISALAMANIEALTDPEITLPGITIECNNIQTKGKCFRPDFGRWKMCGEAMFNPCVTTGNPQDYCIEPC